MKKTVCLFHKAPMLSVVMVLLFSLESLAQTENPRGVYQLMTITGKQGEIISPFDQYKICMDNLTLHAAVTNGRVFIGKNDATTFNYTGSDPKTPDDKSSLIYDSDSHRFKLKWWSQYTNHAIFPDNDWCIEQYESGHMNTALKILLDETKTPGGTDKKNPLIGLWRTLGSLESLKDAKNAIDVMKTNVRSSTESYMKFTPDHMLEIFLNPTYKQLSGASSDVVYGSKNSVTFYGLQQAVKWIDKTHVALDVSNTNRASYVILERADLDCPLWDRFIGWF